MRKRWKTSCHTDQVDILKLGLKETVLTAWPGKPSASLLIRLLLAETSNFQWISRTAYDGYPGQDFLLCSPVIAVNMFLRVMKALWGNNGSAVVATDCPSPCRKLLLSGVGSVMWYKWSDCDVAGPSAGCGEEQSSDIQTAEVTPECYNESSVHLSHRLCFYCWMFSLSRFSFSHFSHFFVVTTSRLSTDQHSTDTQHHPQQTPCSWDFRGSIFVMVGNASPEWIPLQTDTITAL